MDKSRILIIEDHAIFRMGLAELINHERDLEVCGEADNVEDAWQNVLQLKPDMVVLDISLKGKNGIDVIEMMNDYGIKTPVLVLSMHSESLYADRAFQAGAKGYIMKQETSESVVDAIRTVLQGRIYASEQFLGNMLSRYVGHTSIPALSPQQRLTKREFEVFEMIGLGSTTKEIAERLSLSAKTIGTYRERIKEKLEITNATELVRQAVHWIESTQKG